MQSGEVSAAFYTSTSTDSEQSGSAEPPAQDASFRGLMEKMAGVFTLELSSASEADRSRFMQVLQGRFVRSRLQVPLHDVPTTVSDICHAPSSVLPVNKRVDWHYLVPDGEGVPLSSHPSAESTIASAANEQAHTQRVFSSAPSSQDARRWDTLGKKVYSSASLSVRVSSYLAQYDHDLWDEVACLSELVPEDRREDVRRLAEDGSEVSKAQMQGALDVCDTAARGFAAGVSIWRQAWLKGSGFSVEVQQRVADLPYSRALLFGDEAEGALQRLKEAKSTIRSLAPLRQTPRPRPPSRPQGEVRCPYPQGQRPSGPPPTKRWRFSAGKGPPRGGKPPPRRDPKPHV
ncbi:uncharacterized protein LOC135359259 [Latimeria chalumnae]|uniref:uncharacterized protein LOC135359259 n=1 Tax=Latimeria chalumnae TaxID=7897 RepID=UPI00313A8F97